MEGRESEESHKDQGPPKGTASVVGDREIRARVQAMMEHRVERLDSPLEFISDDEAEAEQGPPSEKTKVHR